MRARPEYLPTKRQIAKECRIIRNRWTPAERQRRLVGYGMELTSAIWLPPKIDTSHCTSRVRRLAVEQSA
jgi:hypothetical protein